ncbi:50S ribosomal protein L15 [Candidatus Eisenbacteria bacterium]|uniref:Large ribosomal subunit protein uL15 n=1 Tax=Eiseniibacteriota bacterium TaxID=2212470 RepID=A0ABV6YKW7_UNCEI
MKLNQLKPARGATKKRRRLGAGTGTGRGGTCTKGHKGQNCRSGGGTPPWFEGGQMPLQRRIPKRGFHNLGRKVYQVVNVGDLALFEAGSTVGVAELREAGLVKKAGVPVKLLGNGDLEFALTIKVHAASKSAVEKVDQSKGKLEILSRG